MELQHHPDIGHYFDFMEVGKRSFDKRQVASIHDNLGEFIHGFPDIFGSSYHFVADCSSGRYLHVSPACKQVTGFDVDYFMGSGLYGYLNMKIPRHEKQMKSVTKRCWEFIHLLPRPERIRTYVSFDYIMRHRQTGKLVRILDRGRPIALDLDGKIWLFLVIGCDISHLKSCKPGTSPSASLHREHTGKNYFLNSVSNELVCNDDLSRREKEVLTYYGRGLTSSEIAEKLFISKYTIQSHRSNLYKKTGSSNLAELRYFARTYYS